MKVHKARIFTAVLTGALILYLYQSYFLVPSVQEQFGTHPLQLNLQTTINGENEHKITERAEIQDSNNFAEKNGALKKHFMVIVIPSMPKSKVYRHYLRTKWLNMSSWGSHEFEGVDNKYLDFKLMFVIGKEKNGTYSDDFIKEMSINDDIYLIDLVESKRILRDKVLFGMKKSVELFDYKYFIKIDHDTLVDLPNLAKGIQTLSDENVYTGACKSRVKRGEFRGSSFRYCVGNAYILTRDLVQKISSLTEEETNNSLNPEDGYTGWLVAEVKRKFNISNTLPQVTEQIVKRFNYKVKDGIYRFDDWFYHWLKGIYRMERTFECRIRANLTLCPSMNYYYENVNSTTCICGII